MPHRYHITMFWSDENQRWIADVPDLRPCSAHGATPEEALAEVQIAIGLWLGTAAERGYPIPAGKYQPAPAERRAA